jgi:hypothetical protein
MARWLEEEEEEVVVAVRKVLSCQRVCGMMVVELEVSCQLLAV